MDYLAGFIVMLPLIGIGILIIKKAQNLADWAYRFSDAISKSIYLWSYRFVGSWAIGFSFFLFYLICFS
jgi:hypothetical protein